LNREAAVLSILAFVLAYTWVGYPALLWIACRLFRRAGATGEYLPFVSVIVPVHNEQSGIAAKLEDCLALNYPRDRLEIIVASDGSTDATEAIVRQYADRDPRIRLLKSECRAGKSGVQNLGVRESRGDLLFLTDANTRTPANVLRLLSSNFSDPPVGLVSATVNFATGSDAVSQGQSLYWRYEYFLRQAESDIGILATGGGAAMMIRRELYAPIPPRYGDDCILPLDVRLKGYLVLNDPRAEVFDHPPHSVAGELRGRIRMTARNWTGTLSRPALLNPLRFPFTALGLISHKLLRWLTPFFLLTILALNTALIFRGVAVGLWTLQFAFYFAAFIGWRRIRRQRPAGIFGHAFSFCLANAGFLLGMAKVVRNQKIVTY
jgi:cellulose synthase/poly-beta-1,6-N-acetylglucosamine synthase-like glycosyltransferase